MHTQIFHLDFTIKKYVATSLTELYQVHSIQLGFAEEHRRIYCEQSLKGHPQGVIELTEYLANHPTINSLCYIPFMMIALLFLYNQEVSLPFNSVELQSFYLSYYMLASWPLS